MTDRWWKKAVAYQIYPKSFCDSNGDGVGDLNGIISKLDYLADLGIDVVWLSPINRSPMDDNGYDISDYYTIDPCFGTNEDMDRLLDEAKRRGIRILMDLVINHCSDEHAWFQAALKDPQGKYGGYFYIKKGEAGGPPNNWRSIFGGSAWERIPGTDDYYLHIFTKKQPDLNWENPHLREEIYRFINFWLDKGVAGFRLDAIPFIKKEPGLPSYPADAEDGLVSVHHGALNRPGIERFLNEMKEKTYGRRDSMTVGEVSGVFGRDMLPYISQKDGFFSMIFDFSYANLDLVEPNGFWCQPRAWGSDELRNILNATHTAIQPEGWLANSLECHDSPRAIDHYLPQEGRDYYGASMLAVMVLCLRGTPFIYQGQELGMRNYALPSIDDYDDCSSKNQYATALRMGFTPPEALGFIQKRSRDNTRHPFAWNGGPNAGFTTGKPWFHVSPDCAAINAEAQVNDPKSLYSFYKKLIALKKNERYAETLSDGEFIPILQDYPHVVAYERKSDYNSIVVLCNYQNQREDIRFSREARVLINNCDTLEAADGVLVLQPYQALVMEYC